MKKLILMLSVLWIFESCLLNLDQSDYIDSARDYLVENYDDSFEYDSIHVNRSWNHANNQIFVKFRAAKLNNKIVTVKIDEIRENVFISNHSYSSNYLCVRFENQEIEYYKDIFEKYFTQCRIIIDNSNRLTKYSGVIFLDDNETYEEIKETNTETSFESYLYLINDCEFRNCITIVVTGNQNNYVGFEDLLKASLMDFYDKSIKLDGNFYVVPSLDEDFSKNHSFAAKIDGYNHSGEHYRYKYTLIK
ncbi:MAG: hypothetical protein K6A43_09275 [Treponema sp.]|nr:hypothetical protein [Treponema sp.]